MQTVRISTTVVKGPVCITGANSYTRAVTFRQDLGKRIADARLVAGYKTPGAFAAKLASIGVRTERGKLASRRWVAGLESGEYVPSFEQLPVIAGVLGTKPWTLAWGASVQGDSDFVAAMRGLDEQLDDRGRLTVLLLAQQEARLVRDMASPWDKVATAGPIPVPRGFVQEPEPPEKTALPQPVRRRRAAQ